MKVKDFLEHIDLNNLLDQIIIINENYDTLEAIYFDSNREYCKQVIDLTILDRTIDYFTVKLNEDNFMDYEVYLKDELNTWCWYNTSRKECKKEIYNTKEECLQGAIEYTKMRIPFNCDFWNNLNLNNSIEVEEALNNYGIYIEKLE